MLSSTQSRAVSFIEPPGIFYVQWWILYFRLFERRLFFMFKEHGFIIEDIWITQNLSLFFFPTFRYFHFILHFSIASCRSSCRSELTSAHARCMYGLHISRSKCLNTRYSLCKLHFKQRFGSLFLYLFSEREFLWDEIGAFAEKVRSLLLILRTF